MREYFYVIMPISSDPEYDLKGEIIKKVSYNYKMKPFFPFDSTQSNSYNVFSKLSKSSFVFADLSFERPSCYYELGVAQALKKSTFIVARLGTPIHQAQGAVHYYDGLPRYEELVRKAIVERVSKKKVA